MEVRKLAGRGWLCFLSRFWCDGPFSLSTPFFLNGFYGPRGVFTVPSLRCGRPPLRKITFPSGVVQEGRALLNLSFPTRFSWDQGSSSKDQAQVDVQFPTKRSSSSCRIVLAKPSYTPRQFSERAINYKAFPVFEQVFLSHL